VNGGTEPGSVVKNGHQFRMTQKGEVRRKCLLRFQVKKGRISAKKRAVNDLGGRPRTKSNYQCEGKKGRRPTTHAEAAGGKDGGPGDRIAQHKK